jgi:hypothetical protein
VSVREEVRAKLAAKDPRYAKLFGVPPGKARPKLALPVCPLRGDPTGETRPCLTCTGTVAVPLFGCSAHGVCTDAKLVAGVKCCRICTDRP